MDRQELNEKTVSIFVLVLWLARENASPHFLVPFGNFDQSVIWSLSEIRGFAAFPARRINQKTGESGFIF